VNTISARLQLSGIEPRASAAKRLAKALKLYGIVRRVVTVTAFDGRRIGDTGSFRLIYQKFIFILGGLLYVQYRWAARRLLVNSG
jgi:hypothetical protein